MKWEEIIISALRNKENLDLALEKAAKVAPNEVSLLLKNFPENIDMLAENLNYYPTTISLLYFHFLSNKRKRLNEFPPKNRKNILKTSLDASLKAFTISKNLGEKALEGYFLLMAAGSFYRLREFSEAEKAFTEALEKYRHLAKENQEVYASDIADILNSFGILYNDTKRFSQAEKAYKEALEIRRNLAEENPDIYAPNVADTLNNLGTLYRETGKFSEAEKAYKEALEKYRCFAKENPEDYVSYVAMALGNLGNLYWDMKRFSQAEKAFTEALEKYMRFAKENQEVYASDIADILNSFGILYNDTKRFSQAEKAYKEALEIRRNLAEENPGIYTSDVADTLNNLGTLYFTTEKFSEAEKSYEEALEKYRYLAETHPGVYTPYIAIILSNIGVLYRNAKRFSEAEEAFTEALEKYRHLAETHPDVYTPDIAMTLQNLGGLQFDIRKFFQAEKAFTEALEKYRHLAETHPDVYTPDVAMTLHNLGTLYNDREEYSQAEKAFTEALEKYRHLEKENKEVYKPYIAATLNNFGSLYKDTKRFSQAERAYEEALEIRRNLAEENPEIYTSDVADTLNNLGILYFTTEKFSEAEKSYKEALKTYIESASWFYAAKIAHNLFEINLDENILEKSIKLLEMAILFSEEEKYRYVQKWEIESLYLDLLDLDINSFGVLESLRDPQSLSLHWSQILSNEKLERAQRDLQFQKRLVKRFLKKQVPYSNPVLADLLENLLFIYVQELENYILFFVMEKDGIKRFKCPKEFFFIGSKLIYNLEIQHTFAKKGQNMEKVIQQFEILSRKWCGILPREVRDLIQEKDQLVFSPDSYCSVLPLEALPLDGQPLCIEKTVVRVTSLRQFLTLLKRTPSFDSSLIVGNPWPECNKEQLIYSLPQNSKYFRLFFLDGAEEEARVLVESLRNQLPKCTLLLGQKATGKRFLSEVSNYSLIHFSGHGSLGRILFLSGPLKGFPPPFEPEEFSNLRKAKRIEGNITMMQDWHPVTDLDLFDVQITDGAIIFLNACEMGQHKYLGGGYYQGLPAVFLKNGAYSVVSSLFPIYDEQSKVFALHFYEALFNTHSVAKSLKKARIWAKDNYEAQIYWVPYIHYGPTG